MRHLWLSWVLAVGCQPSPDDSDPGTFVGNPGELDVSVRGVSEDIHLDSVSVPAVEWVTDDCDGAVVTVPISITFDGLDDVIDGVEVPGGDFCFGALLLASDEPVEVTGTTGNGTPFTYFLDMEQVEVDRWFRIDGESFLVTLELSGIDAAALDAVGGSLVFDGNSPESTALSETAAVGELHDQRDPNGYLGTDAGMALDAAASKESAGCAAVGSLPAASWLWGLAALLVLRRRDGTLPG